MFDIKEKIALITGAASGIGLAYVKELLRNGLKGATITDVDEEKGNNAVLQICKEFGKDRAIFIKVDVTIANELESAFKKSLAHWKTLNIVINNAGIMNDAHWELEIAINCNHVVRRSLLAIQYMGKNNGGNGGIVVNIASILGLQPLAGCPIYVGTKHFVVGLDRSLGTKYFHDLTGLTFLTMCPGVTDTPLISEAGHFALQGLPGIDRALVEGLTDLPIQKPEDVAKGMVTLITEGENGSVWVKEGAEPIYKIEFPARQDLRRN